MGYSTSCPARSKLTMRTRVRLVQATVSVGLTLTKQRFDMSAASPGPPSARRAQYAQRTAPRPEGNVLFRLTPPRPNVGCGHAKKPLLAISRFKARTRWAAQCAAL